MRITAAVLQPRTFIQGPFVCRSDLHFQKGEATIALPAVLGHEGSGTVEAVAARTNGVRRGPGGGGAVG